MPKSKPLKKSPNLKQVQKIFEKDPKMLEDFTKSLSTQVDKKELSKHGGPLSQIAGAIQSYAGQYNPDDISVDTYNKLRMNAQIAAGLKVIKLPIIGQQWTTVCDDKDIGEFIDQLLRPMWYNLLTSTLTAVDFGFAAHEIVYDVQDITLNRKYEKKSFFNKKAVVWKKFKSLYPDTVNIKLDEMENFDGIVQKWVGNNIRIPVEKSFIFTHDKGDSFGNLFGVSRLKPAYDCWYWWISLVQFMMRYFERKGTPPVIVKFPLGQTKDGTDHADIALEMGKALIGESVIAIPSTTYENTPPKWDLNYLLDDKRGEMFLSALTFFENKMLRGMFVPERTITQDSSSKAGSYSLSQTHADMFLLGEEALLVDIENQLNKYVVRRLIEYNFGAKAPQCYIKIERITEARKGFLKDVFMEMIKQGTAIPAAREIADVVGVPLTDEQETTVADQLRNRDNSKGKLDNSIKVTNKDNEIDNKKDKVDKKSDESKKYSDVYLTENVSLPEIEDRMNKSEKQYYDNLVGILDKQRDLVVKKASSLLSENGSIENLFYSKVLEGDNENIILWQPFRAKILSTISKMAQESFLFGQETALKELNIENNPVLNKEGKSFIQDRSRMITDQYFNNMKYKTELTLLSISNENRSLEDILDNIKLQFETIKNKNLVDIISSESALFLNKGRAKIAQENI